MAAQTVLICQNTACRRAGSAKVLAAFEAALATLPANSLASPADQGSDEGSLAAPRLLPEGDSLSVIDITVSGCRCLGQCGNGPMVLVLPEQVWYHRVHPDEVPAVVRHLQSGKWLERMLYPRFHSISGNIQTPPESVN